MSDCPRLVTQAINLTQLNSLSYLALMEVLEYRKLNKMKVQLNTFQHLCGKLRCSSVSVGEKKKHLVAHDRNKREE